MWCIKLPRKSRELVIRGRASTPYIGLGRKIVNTSIATFTCHLSYMDCDPDSNLDSGPGARVNANLEDRIQYLKLKR